jgi:hypothetical protein
MMLDPLFVAALLEGFEGTLDEVVGRVESPDLNGQLDSLRGQVAALRICIEEPLVRREADRTALGDKVWASVAGATGCWDDLPALFP